MFRQIKQLIGESAVFGISSVLTTGINVLLIPVYASEFPPGEYGYLGLVTVTVILLNIVLVAGLDNSVAIWFYDKEAENERKVTFSSWIWFLFIFSLLLSSFIFLNSHQLSNILLKDTSRYLYFQIVAIQIAFTGFQKVVNVFFRVRRKPIGAVAYAGVLSLLTLLSAIYFVKVRHSGIEGIFKAQAIVSAVGFGGFLILLRGWYKLSHFRVERLVEMLRFSIPLIPSSLSFWAMNYAGLYILKQYSSETNVGIYQMAYNISSVPGLISTAFLQAFTPFAASIMKEENKEIIYARIYSSYVTIMVVINLFMYFFIQDIVILFLNDSYTNIQFITPLLSFNVILIGIAQVLLIGSAIKKSNMPYFKAIMCALALSLPLFFSLVPVYGMSGLVAVLIFANTIIAAIAYIESQKLLRIPYNIKYTVSVMCVSQIFGVMVSLILLPMLNHFVFRFLCFVMVALFIMYFFLRIEKIRVNALKFTLFRFKKHIGFSIRA